jgi:hypothetical protein
MDVAVCSIVEGMNDVHVLRRVPGRDHHGEVHTRGGGTNRKHQRRRCALLLLPFEFCSVGLVVLSMTLSCVLWSNAHGLPPPSCLCARLSCPPPHSPSPLQPCVCLCLVCPRPHPSPHLSAAAMQLSTFCLPPRSDASVYALSRPQSAAMRLFGLTQRDVLDAPAAKLFPEPLCNYAQVGQEGRRPCHCAVSAVRVSSCIHLLLQVALRPELAGATSRTFRTNLWSP